MSNDTAREKTSTRTQRAVQKGIAAALAEQSALMEDLYMGFGARARTRHLLYGHEGDFGSCGERHCQEDNALLNRAWHMLSKSSYPTVLTGE